LFTFLSGATKAKAFFTETLEDLSYSRVALALEPHLVSTIETIRFKPDDALQDFALPRFMRNLLQNAVDDTVEGKVREAVAVLVAGAFAAAATAFKKTVPGVPVPAEDAETADADPDADEMAADAVAEEDDAGTNAVASSEAAIAIAAGAGVAAVVALKRKDKQRGGAMVPVEVKPEIVPQYRLEGDANGAACFSTASFCHFLSLSVSSDRYFQSLVVAVWTQICLF